MPDLQTMKWLDLSAHGVKLRLFQLTDKTVNLVLTGVRPGTIEFQAVQELGFSPSASGRTMVRAGSDIQTRLFRRIFPKNVVRDMPVDEVWMRVKGQTPTVSSESARSMIGKNRGGESVHISPDGARYVRDYRGKTTMELEAADSTDAGGSASAARFLRAPDAQALAWCADGFVGEMLQGRNMDSTDIRRFGGTVYAEPGPLEMTDSRCREIQEAIKAAMQRALANRTTQADANAFEIAVTLTENQPTFAFRTSSSVENQQYSTPLPMSIAVQHILGDTSGKRLLEPTIGNGSLVAAVPAGTNIVGVEIDPSRAGQAVHLRPGMQIITGDALGIHRLVDGEFDCVVANPPFGGLAQPVAFENLRCNRIDHLIALKALNHRTHNGRAVFIIAADRESLFEPGKVAGGSKSFFAWLSDHYVVEDAVEMDPTLYRKQGADYPVRMVTVGRRRTTAEAADALQTKAHRLPERLPVIHTWAALWEHATQLSARLNTLELDVSATNAVLPAIEPAEASAPAESAQTGGLDDASVSHEALPESIPAEFNDYQAPYVPSSTLNEPSAMIPRNLQEPVRIALSRLVEQVGTDVDSYVARCLKLTPEEMELAFSAEQVDAIALGIARAEEGRGFINGDQTGQGKGRWVAAMARYAALNNQAVIFLTEKANLFSDFWRDLKDIDSHELFRPLILNADEPIRNMDTNKVEVPASTPGVLKPLMDADLPLLDTGYNLMLATYSQFNRERSVSKKATWLPGAARDAMVLLDESHVAAGDSNTADNIGLAVENARSGLYSSATYAKNAKNMRAYAKVFPPSVQIESLAETLQIGGEPLQEILSSMLAEDGAFIRREHDLSKLEFDTVVTEDTRERDETWADSLSAALRAMAYFSGDVTRVMKRADKEIKKKLAALPEAIRAGNRMGVSYQGFGSRLYTILRQFSLAIKIDKVADHAIAAAKAGRKPVIVLEQTFESLLRETLMTVQDLELDPGELDLMGAVTKIDTLAGREISMPTFRDVMRRVAYKLEYIYVRDDYGNGHHEHVRSMAKDEDELEAINLAIQEIHDQIGRLPDIPVSPLDTLRHKMDAAGFKTGEISGRAFQVEPSPEDPSKTIVSLRPDSRLQTLSDFNNGRIDALELTVAGSTGLSAHASSKFADQRQREMIEAQIANNVAQRVQFWGRVNRRGQVNVPRITSVVTTLTSEMRVLAMQNAKLRKLSANTQSNRNSQAEMRDVPDILNPIGNEICRRYLVENPDISALLDIDPEEPTNSDDEAYFANKLTGRIALLPVAQQKAAYAELTRVFNETLKEMVSKGQNPFETSVHDWRARIIDRKVFRAGEGSGSVFDQPVYISRIEWDEEVTPYSSADMVAAIEHARRYLVDNDNRFTLSENKYGRTVLSKWVIEFDRVLADIATAFKEVQSKTLKMMSSFSSIQEAIAAADPNPIKNAAIRHKWLHENLGHVMPGSIISFTGREEQVEKGMVVGLQVPDDRFQAHLLGQYILRVVVPGSDKRQELTMNQLIGDPAYQPQHALGSDFMDPLKAFDVAKPGIITYTRQILNGNMFAAAQFVAQNKLGHAGIFTDEAGIRHRAIVLHSYVSESDVMDMPIGLTRQHAAKLLESAYALGIRACITASATLDEKQCQVIYEPTRPSSLTIQTHGSKSVGGIVYANKDVRKITGEFAGNRKSMLATVDFSHMQAVIGVLIDTCGQAFYVNAATAKRLVPELAPQDTNLLGGTDEQSVTQRPKFAA